MLEACKMEHYCNSCTGGGRWQSQASRHRAPVGSSTRNCAGVITTWYLVKYICEALSKFSIIKIVSFIIKLQLCVVHCSIIYIMGMMGVFKWLRKDIIQRDRNRRGMSPKFNELDSEAYQTALQAFLERRKSPDSPGWIESPPRYPPDVGFNLSPKKHRVNEKNNKNQINVATMCGVPQALAFEIYEIGWVAGTEDRYLELIYAEWQNTKVALRRPVHPDCRNVVKADLDVLGEIRHPNLLLLMGVTQTDDYGLVAIFEPVDCTLFNYIHEQGEKISLQEIIKSASSLAGALKHAHMRGYIHSALSSHCVFLASSGIVKLGGWELASKINDTKPPKEFAERLRSEIFRWQAPELFRDQKPTAVTDIYGLTLLMWEMYTRNIPWAGMDVFEIGVQYVNLKKSVKTNSHNFPPLLNNLLDVGLQLEVAKRTLDMTKMARFLHRLDTHYQNDESIYIEQFLDNKNQSNFTNCSSTFAGMINSDETSITRTARSRLRQCCGEESRIRPQKLFTNDPTDNSRLENEEKVGETDRKKSLITDNSTIDSATFSNKLIDTADARLSIKKIKETLANEREKFFSEIYTKRGITQPQSKFSPNKMENLDLNEVEVQIIKFPEPVVTLPSSLSRETCEESSTSVKNARSKTEVFKPEIKSSFATLWKKEHAICMSKMGNDSPIYSRGLIVDEGRRTKSPMSDETYTVDKPCLSGADSTENLTNETSGNSRAIETLKQALERATDIVKSSTNIVERDSIDSPPVRDAQVNVSVRNERLFAELCQVSDDTPDEIRSVEQDNGNSPMKILQQSTELISTKLILLASSNQTREVVNNDCSDGEERLKSTKNIQKPLKQMSFDEIDSRHRLYTCDDRNGVFGCSISLPDNLHHVGARTFPKSTEKIDPQKIEDLYIDDEFDENSLAPNMILYSSSAEDADDEYFLSY